MNSGQDKLLLKNTSFSPQNFSGDFFSLIMLCFKVYDRDPLYLFVPCNFHSFVYDDIIQVRLEKVKCLTILAVHSLCYQFYNIFRPGKDCGSAYTDVNADSKPDIERESLNFP